MRRVNELGFSLVEVLVVLLVAAGLSVGVGALYGMVAEAMERRGEAARIEDTLVRLHGLAVALDRAPGLTSVTAASSSELVWTAAPSGQIEPVTMRLTGKALTWAGFSDREDGRLDLGDFDAIRFQFLVGRDALRWQDTPTPPIRAIRLDLESGRRHWETMLWMAAGEGT